MKTKQLQTSLILQILSIIKPIIDEIIFIDDNYFYLQKQNNTIQQNITVQQKNTQDQIMQQEYTLLKQENYQLKNQISQLKNAFDLNRDILKIISQEAKSKQPRVEMLYQIINRLTSINNQIMINTADLILQKNQHKLQKQTLKTQMYTLKQKLNSVSQQEIMISQSTKINELNLYFKNKINQLQLEIKSLEQDRILKQQEILNLNNKITFYENQLQKKSLIPTIDKKYQSQLPPTVKFPITQQMSINDQKSIKRHYTTSKENKLQIKLNILNKQMWKLKIYTQELQYRLLTLIKAMDLQDEVKKTQKTSIKTQRRKCLQGTYDRELIEVKLLKFALNNLVKHQKEQNRDMLFTLTNRNFNAISRFFGEGVNRNRQHYLYKSVEKQNKVKMKPNIINETVQDESVQE